MKYRYDGGEECHDGRHPSPIGCCAEESANLVSERRCDGLTMGPIAGPSHGIAPNTPIAIPRCSAWNMSEMMPLISALLRRTHPALVIVLHPNTPAKKRVTSSPLRDCTPQTAESNATSGISVTT